MPDAEVYRPVLSTLLWPLLWGGLVVLLLGGRQMYRLVRRYQALRSQQQLIRVHTEGVDELIAKALRHIDEIRSSLMQGTIKADDAAEQLSGIGRVVVDTLWNHRTLYRSHREIEQSRLTQLSSAVGVAYPFEFGTSWPEDTDPLLLCEYMTEVVRSCR